jgi:hypothetical protein
MPSVGANPRVYEPPEQVLACPGVWGVVLSERRQRAVAAAGDEIFSGPDQECQAGGVTGAVRISATLPLTNPDIAEFSGTIERLVFSGIP